MKTGKARYPEPPSDFLHLAAMEPGRKTGKTLAPWTRSAPSWASRNGARSLRPGKTAELGFSESWVWRPQWSPVVKTREDEDGSLLS
jgi:hypothetical protein